MPKYLLDFATSSYLSFAVFFYFFHARDHGGGLSSYFIASACAVGLALCVRGYLRDRNLSPERRQVITEAWAIGTDIVPIYARHRDLFSPAENAEFDANVRGFLITGVLFIGCSVVTMVQMALFFSEIFSHDPHSSSLPLPQLPVIMPMATFSIGYLTQARYLLMVLTAMTTIRRNIDAVQDAAKLRAARSGDGK